MKKRIYGVFNIEVDNFSFPDNEREKFCPEIFYTHSGVAYYRIAATWFQYMHLRFRFWKMRKFYGYKIRIKKVD